jgi:glycosyltransferase involved in cell wall biosynthesis
LSRLSIITVNLNNRDGLKKTVESVISQNFADFEYLVIDGASTDGSVDVIRQYEGRIAHWQSEPDRGIYEAMNKGIRRAQGEYCLFLNSGDWLASEHVLADVFAHKTDADVIAGNVYFFDSAKNRIQWTVCSPEKVTAKTLFYGNIPHQAAFIRRDLFRSVGFYDERMKIASDWAFFLEAFLVHGASYRHFDGVVSYFNMEGISCNPATNSLPRREQMAVLQAKYPLFIDDFMQLESLENRERAWRDSRERRLLEWFRRFGIIRAGIFLQRVWDYFRKRIRR